MLTYSKQTPGDTLLIDFSKSFKNRAKSMGLSKQPCITPLHQLKKSVRSSKKGEIGCGQYFKTHDYALTPYPKTFPRWVWSIIEDQL